MNLKNAEIITEKAVKKAVWANGQCDCNCDCACLETQSQLDFDSLECNDC